MSSFGTLGVRVYTSRAQLPVEGAAVVFSQTENGKRRVLGVERSDQSGKVKPLTVPTPERTDSESPGTARPYAQVDVWVEHPEFELLVVEGAQVFAGVESLLELQLDPRVAGEDWTQQEQDRPIPDQGL
ncbi:MAG: spore cortex-lytic protein [Oscillospiraceae bacterium]|nr:spore cortex-lytic protein [Oscillospiraceae bacterium]